MTYHEIDNGIGSSLHSAILWQYENAEKLKAFIESMCEAAYLAVDDFWDKWATFRTNVDLAASKEDATFSLSVIGATCGIPRPNGILDATYAKLIKCRMKLSMTTAATTKDYYEYINELFNGTVTLADMLNMSVTTSCSAVLDSEEYKLYHSEDSNAYGLYWLILPTGVKRGVSGWSGTVFGFDMSDRSYTFIGSVEDGATYRVEETETGGIYTYSLYKNNVVISTKQSDSIIDGDIEFILNNGGNGISIIRATTLIPAIGPFGTSFMTQYQYQFIKEAST